MTVPDVFSHQIKLAEIREVRITADTTEEPSRYFIPNKEKDND